MPRPASVAPDAERPPPLTVVGVTLEVGAEQEALGALLLVLTLTPEEQRDLPAG